MSPRIRLLLVLLALALPGSILVYVSTVSEPGPLEFDGAPLSRRLAGYVQDREQALTPEVLRRIDPDLYLLWHYTAPEAPPIWSYLAFYRGIVFTGAHDPAVCYPAQGWDITASRDLEVPMPDGGRLRARLLQAVRSGQEEVVLYWFQPAGRWPGAAWAEQLLRVYDSALGAPQYAFVRLSAPARPDAREALLRFARAIAPQVRRVLEQARPPAG